MEGVGKRPQWWTAVIHCAYGPGRLRLFTLLDLLTLASSMIVTDAIKNATGGQEDKVKNNNKDWTSNLNDTYHVRPLLHRLVSPSC